MSNTLTGLIPTIYAARDVVSRELTGFIAAVTVDATAERAAVGQPVRVPITPPQAAVDISASMTMPTPSGQTIGFVDMTITKARAVQIPWSGEEQLSLGAGGAGPSVDPVIRDQIAQAMRTLANEIEGDLAGQYVYASRVVGAAGTTPFATGITETAQLRKAFDDNGAPLSDRQLIINTSAGMNLRSLSQLTKVNEAGTNAVQSDGSLINLTGFSIRESQAVQTHVKGTGTGYLTNGSTGIGVTSIAMQTGSGTVLPGDIVTFAADAVNKYTVNTGITVPGTIQLNSPAPLVQIPTGNAMTIQNGYAANFAFCRSAMILLARAPALPKGGDAAVDRTQVSDPATGLVFEVASYLGYHASFLEVSLAWGVKNIKSAHSIILMG